MEKHEAEALLKERIYESGAVLRSRYVVALLLQPNKPDMSIIAMVRIFLDENEIDEQTSLSAMANNVANCAFDLSPQITGVSIWIFVGDSNGYDRRFASQTREDFAAGLPIKLSARLKDIAKAIRAKLTSEDRFNLVVNDMNCMKLALGIKLMLCETTSEWTEESLKRTVCEIAKAVVEREPLVSSFGVGLYPQDLSTRIDFLDEQKKLDAADIVLEPFSEASFRINHVDMGMSG